MRLVVVRQWLLLTVPGRAPVFKGLGQAIVVAVVAALLLRLDPLGLEEATAELAENQAMKITSALYPAFNEAEERVTVVMIMEDYLHGIDSSWPMRYDAQGELLRRIESFGPTAMFVDIVYHKAHTGGLDGSHQDLPGDLLKGLDPGTPVYLAGLLRQSLADKSLCDENMHSRGPLLDPKSVLKPIRQYPDPRDPTGQTLIDRDTIALVEWSGCGDQYPLYFGTGSKVGMTPAYALFREYQCRKRDKPEFCDKADAHERFKQPMTVRWGAFPPSMQQRYYGHGACQKAQSPDGLVEQWTVRLTALFRQLTLAALPEMRGRLSNEDLLKCPAVSIIPASLLLSVDGKACRDPQQREHLNPVQLRDCERLDGLLAKALVFVGVQVPAVSGTIVSPVHGQLPSVVLHAMAADNLLRMGSRYLKEPPRWFRAILDPAILLLVAVVTFFASPRLSRLCLITGTVLWIILTVVACARGELGMAAMLLGGGALVFLLDPTALPRGLVNFLAVTVVAILTIQVWHYAPMNWLILAIAAVLVSEKVHADKHRHEETLPLLARLAHFWAAFVHLQILLKWRSPQNIQGSQ